MSPILYMYMYTAHACCLPVVPYCVLDSSPRLSSLLATPTIPHAHQAPPPEVTSEAVEKLKDAFLEYLDGNMVCVGGEMCAVQVILPTTVWYCDEIACGSDTRH